MHHHNFHFSIETHNFTLYFVHMHNFCGYVLSMVGHYKEAFLMTETITCPKYSTVWIIAVRSLGVFLVLTINDCLHGSFIELHHIKNHEQKTNDTFLWRSPLSSSNPKKIKMAKSLNQYKQKNLSNEYSLMDFFRLDTVHLKSSTYKERTEESQEQQNQSS